MVPSEMAGNSQHGEPGVKLAPLRCRIPSMTGPWRFRQRRGLAGGRRGPLGQRQGVTDHTGKHP
jgi:hypothetical protein